MERHFDQELVDLKEQIALMGARAEAILQKSIEAIRRRDPAIAEEAIADDRAVDRMEVDIEERCVNLLALRQPMAVDLRFLTAALKISNDLERVGDHGVNMAGNALRLCRLPRLPLLPEIYQLSKMATDMLRDALDAFLLRDAAGGRDLVSRDDRVDDLNRRIFHELMTRMHADPEGMTCFIEWIMVARNLERVADLATNIAEEVVFITEARIIKHREEGDAPAGGTSPPTSERES